MFCSKNKKSIHLYTPVYFINLGFKGVYITWTCFPDILLLYSSIPSKVSRFHCTISKKYFPGLDDLSAAELELVVLCKLEQAEIAQLKHHAPMAARIVLASLKLLQASNIFRKKREVPIQRRLVFCTSFTLNVP